MKQGEEEETPPASPRDWKFRRRREGERGERERRNNERERKEKMLEH